MPRKIVYEPLLSFSSTYVSNLSMVGIFEGFGALRTVSVIAKLKWSLFCRNLNI